MFPVWMYTVEHKCPIQLLSGPGVFNVRMFPETIRQLEQDFECTLLRIETDKPGNIVWERT